ncbi:sterol desaturase/sphingolipid hydroxylase (fatty acid hydroxylase superfamily) [Algoriphagus sp. 4150]|uniref:hypothetical protein n=1 Tax=Algoriphagus sp. 4150 TaxID=2817756 RepID=UPI00285EF80D|nr:hypothetical protein [Algoriphagus sp. 4150]MDR7127687.1 sterol desaturase/sphingolipid hydroxylase (fatty acid hydroxylase superfamily) [Algoriphagus sp. 4150]
MKSIMSTLNRISVNRNLFFFWILFSLTSSACGMQEDTTLQIEEEFDEFLKKEKSSLSDSLSYYGDLREITKLKYEIAREKYFENQYSQYFTENLKHRKQTFDWQLFSTKLIFFTVIIIVLCGLLFSGIQFYQSIKQTAALYKLANAENIEQLAKLDPAEKTEIELSISNGVKITSSIIGLVILVVSIAFFYLYILYVYPINQINIDNANFNKTEI